MTIPVGTGVNHTAFVEPIDDEQRRNTTPAMGPVLDTNPNRRWLESSDLAEVFMIVCVHLLTCMWWWVGRAVSGNQRCLANC